MTTRAAPVDKSRERIRDMFAAVAPRYDFLNHLLSASLDVVWRREAARALTDENGYRVLDLCCGTGDQAIALQRRGHRVVAADFCLPMLVLAGAKFRRLGARSPQRLVADALALPFPSETFSAASISFGVRNVAELDQALGQVTRVLRVGGRLAILEFAVPEGRVLQGAYLVYLRLMLPAIAGLFSPRGGAYAYLRDSVLEFPQRQAFLNHLERAGFTDVRFRDLSGGIVCLYTARRRATGAGQSIGERQEPDPEMDRR